jgi:hypothetical protein
MLLGIGILYAGHQFTAWGDEDSKTAKIAELARLQGLARMMEQSKAAGREAATEMVRSMTDKTFAQFPNMPPEKRAAVEAASQQFLAEVDNSFDHDDAVRAWGRFYSQGLTDQELDAIVAYYRSPVGQKDVQASQSALPQFQKYMAEKRTVAMKAVVADYTAALQRIANPSKDGSIQPEVLSMHPLGSNPSAPDGKVVADSVSYRCEVPPSAASRARDVPPSGRSVLCVCVDEKGALTQDPLITESSGDSKVDSGAVKLARLDSGRYKPPTVAGQPQKGCFRFAINFGHQE